MINDPNILYHKSHQKSSPTDKLFNTIGDMIEEQTNLTARDLEKTAIVEGLTKKQLYSFNKGYLDLLLELYAILYAEEDTDKYIEGVEFGIRLIKGLKGGK